jgi:hypothetical protein
MTIALGRDGLGSRSFAMIFFARPKNGKPTWVARFEFFGELYVVAAISSLVMVSVSLSAFSALSRVFTLLQRSVIGPAEPSPRTYVCIGNKELPPGSPGLEAHHEFIDVYR